MTKQKTEIGKTCIYSPEVRNLSPGDCHLDIDHSSLAMRNNQLINKGVCSGGSIHIGNPEA